MTLLWPVVRLPDVKDWAAGYTCFVRTIPVTTVDVTAQKDEKVAVVVDHDKPGDEAVHVRFEAQS